MRKCGILKTVYNLTFMVITIYYYIIMLSPSKIIKHTIFWINQKNKVHNKIKLRLGVANRRYYMMRKMLKRSYYQEKVLLVMGTAKYLHGM